MSNLITTNFKYAAATSFISEVANGPNYLYLFLGRQLPWSNDITPDVPAETNANFKSIWDNMIAAVLVTQNDVSLVIPNIVYTTGTVYTAYSDVVDISTTNSANSFYIINSSNEVFKCISNNHGAISTVMPQGLGNYASNYIQTTGDGYQWKYMLKVSPTDKFLTSNWVPVPIIPPTNSPQSIITNAAIPGSICAINITNSANNFAYANNPVSYIVTITGNGTGANAYANISNSSIQNIVMTNFGQNYTYATVTISNNGVGSAPIATAVMSPYGGHGSNASQELGAKSVMVAMETSDIESGYLTVTNSFRQNGLLLNPLFYGTSNVANTSLLQTATYINVGGGTGAFQNNEQVYQGAGPNYAFSAYVIDYNSSPNLLRLNNVVGIPQIGNILVGAISGSQRYITAVQQPTIQPYTGLILDYDNEIPIQRQLGQMELFQFVETFG